MRYIECNNIVIDRTINLFLYYPKQFYTEQNNKFNVILSSNLLYRTDNRLLRYD